MVTHGFALFPTSLGSCGISWGEGGVTGVQLPEGDAEATRQRVLRRHPTAVETDSPPGEVAQAITAIQALLRGERQDLAAVPLDLDAVPPFHRRVYEVARAIPPGEVLTYGEIAQRLGELGGARAVGQALGQNPFPLVVPCHRVLAAGGKLGGFSAHGGVTTKVRLLTIEGAPIQPSLPLFGD